MAYWTDIFTLETWAQAKAQGFRVTGFPPPTPGPGGYSDKTFARVQVGDILLCYCKAPAKRWVGALRITSPVFQGDELIWGLTPEESPRFPARYEAEPIVTLAPEHGVPAEEAADQLGFLKKLKRWSAYLQRSLYQVPEEDGDRLLDMLREPRAPVPIELPPGAKSKGVEPTLLESKASKPSAGGEDDPAPPTPRIHTEIQGKLRDIGLKEGYDVWVADRGLDYEGGKLGDACLDRLPVVAREETLRVMRNIDVIWFRSGTGHPHKFFEVEHSTGIYSGLLRFNDVMIDFPIPRAFIVADPSMEAKFGREIARRTFAHSGLEEITFFLSYDEVRDTWERFRDLGQGSAAWGKQTEPDRSENELG